MEPVTNTHVRGYPTVEEFSGYRGVCFLSTVFTPGGGGLPQGGNFGEPLEEVRIGEVGPRGPAVELEGGKASFRISR